MFDSHHSPVTLRVREVASRRDGWHPRPLSSLVTLTRLDPSRLTADEALSALETLQRERAVLDALESELLVRAAGAHRVVREVLVEGASDGDANAPRTVVMTDEVVDEIAATLRLSVGSVSSKLRRARLLHGPLSRTREALSAGLITDDHARAICDQAGRMLPRPLGEDDSSDAAFSEACSALQDRVLGKAASETPAETRQRARRAVAAIDAEGARTRRRKARCTRDVRAWGEDDGIGVVMARLSALDAAWVMNAVDAHARTHANDGSLGIDDHATWGEVRAAAFLDLLRGSSSPNRDGGEPAIELQVAIDFDTLIGVTPDLPATVTVGSTASVEVDRDDVLALLADSRTPATVRRLVCDPLSGALVDRGAHRYRVGDDLIAWLVARDRTCRFPGCTRLAQFADADHAVDFAQGGRTTVTNTGMMCRRHHNGKTHGGWRIEDARADGGCTFVSPRGRRFFHEPVRIGPDRPPPPTALRTSPQEASSPDPPPF